MSKKRRMTAVQTGWPKQKPTDFGNRLGFLLAERDLSLTEFARKLGVSKQAVYRYKYVVYPSGKTVNKIARALEVPVWFFYIDDWHQLFIQIN